jgi:hypothetical protein
MQLSEFELDDRIAMLRDNIRQLIARAAALSGNDDDDRTFDHSREEAVQLYDERFARMWEFYLACSEMAFRKQNLMNFQLQLTRRQGVVPMTRNYIAQSEAKLRGLDSARERRFQLAGE